MNALKKRKGVVGSSAVNLINSWKQLVNNISNVSKPKPKIVVEPCHTAYTPPEDETDDTNDTEEDGDDEDDDDDDKEVTETTSHLRLDGSSITTMC